MGICGAHEILRMVLRGGYVEQEDWEDVRVVTDRLMRAGHLSQLQYDKLMKLWQTVRKEQFSEGG